MGSSMTSLSVYPTLAEEILGFLNGFGQSSHHDLGFRIELGSTSIFFYMVSESYQYSYFLFIQCWVCLLYSPHSRCSLLIRGCVGVRFSHVGWGNKLLFPKCPGYSSPRELVFGFEFSWMSIFLHRIQLHYTQWSPTKWALGG